LAMKYGHRTSVDIDLFGQNFIKGEIVQSLYREFGSRSYTTRHPTIGPFFLIILVGRRVPLHKSECRISPVRQIVLNQVTNHLKGLYRRKIILLLSLSERALWRIGW